MDYTLGQCGNTPACEIARTQKIVHVDIDAPFLCSSCGSPLTPPKVVEKSQLPLFAAIGAVLALLAGGAGYYFLLRTPAAPVSLARSVPAAPVAQPAVQPVAPSAAVAAAAAAADAALARETQLEQQAARDAAAQQAQAEAAKARAVQLEQQAQAAQTLSAQKQAAQKLAALKTQQALDAQKKADLAKAALEAQKKAVAQAQAQQRAAAAQLARQNQLAAPAPAAQAEAQRAAPAPLDHPFSARALSGGSPAYPDILADNPRPGSVVVRCQIDEGGHPSGCGVVSQRGGLPFAAAVMSWLNSGGVRFAPITRHGQPVAQSQQWEIRFTPPEAAPAE